MTTRMMTAGRVTLALSLLAAPLGAELYLPAAGGYSFRVAS